MPRFVILQHDHPEMHWDLMLEMGTVLQTWRLAQPPMDVRCAIDALALPDHRALYLEYEGPVSRNRGTVERWDWGVFSEELGSTLEQRRLAFAGCRVRGNVHLDRRDGDFWRFCRVCG